MTKYLQYNDNSIIRHFKKVLLFFCTCDLKKSPFFLPVKKIGLVFQAFENFEFPAHFLSLSPSSEWVITTILIYKYYFKKLYTNLCLKEKKQEQSVIYSGTYNSCITCQFIIYYIIILPKQNIFRGPFSKWFHE